MYLLSEWNVVGDEQITQSTRNNTNHIRSEQGPTWNTTHHIHIHKVKRKFLIYTNIFKDHRQNGTVHNIKRTPYRFILAYMQWRVDAFFKKNILNYFSL